MAQSYEEIFKKTKKKRLFEKKARKHFYIPLKNSTFAPPKEATQLTVNI